jgi:hypothetical protein
MKGMSVLTKFTHPVVYLSRQRRFQSLPITLQLLILSQISKRIKQVLVSELDKLLKEFYVFRHCPKSKYIKFELQNVSYRMSETIFLVPDRL